VAQGADRLAARLSEEVPWLSVRVGYDAGGGWISCAELLAEQRRGGDPTAEWRESLLAQWAERYGAEQPPYVAAMFVLMWCVSVPALVAARSAAVTGAAPDVAPEALAFRRHPVDHYPAEIALLSDRVVDIPEAARSAGRHCRDFADSYEPGTKLSTLQRYGAIEDEYRTAIPAAAPYAAETAAAFGVDLASRWRTSCCFLYALPGVKPCSNCPRLLSVSSGSQ
jgi:hypothetical protein